jgi:hypothetical protein
VRELTGSIRDGSITLVVSADADVDLELWAANQSAKLLRDFFGRSVQIQSTRRQSAAG